MVVWTKRGVASTYTVEKWSDIYNDVEDRWMTWRKMRYNSHVSTQRDLFPSLFRRCVVLCLILCSESATASYVSQDNTPAPRPPPGAYEEVEDM